MKFLLGGSARTLYHRLAVIVIKVPPLKERIEDIPLLCEHFIHQISEKEGVPVKK